MVGGIIAIIGACFLLLGALGIVRLPDVYNRMQAGTKATTLGSILTLAGVAVVIPGWTTKLILLILFIIFTNPVGANSLSRAAHKMGVRLAEQSQCDDLAEDIRKEQEHD